VTKVAEVDHAGIAAALEEAWRTRLPLEPISSGLGVTSIDDAYAIQSRWNEIRLGEGDAVAGRKIGLTSRVVQEQMGVSEPDFGNLWESRRVPVTGGRGAVAASTFLQPRVEAELAFLMGSELPPGEVTREQVMRCAEAVAPALEIVDSRIVDWRITITDTIADNASYGGFALGEWRRDWLEGDLAALDFELRRSGGDGARGAGAAALGHPANAVAWLANRLRSFGVELTPGDVVLSGAVARMLPAAAGDRFVLAVGGEDLLTLDIT